MAINVTPIPGLDPAVNDVRLRTAAFVNAEILPNEEALWRTQRSGELDGDERERARQRSIELREEIKAKANEAGLWAPHLPKEYGGMGLDFLELAYMYEILSYAVGASSLFGIAAPNSGNASVLVKYGTEEQKRKWLLPLIEGEMESGFSMTERDHAGSDPRSIATEAVREGDEWVINGHKWFTLQRHRRRLLHRHVPRQRPVGRARLARPDDPDHRPHRHEGRGHRPRHRHLRARHRPTTARSATRTSGSRSRTRSAGSARATRPPRTGSAPAGSTTA